MNQNELTEFVEEAILVLKEELYHGYLTNAARVEYPISLLRRIRLCYRQRIGTSFKDARGDASNDRAFHQTTKRDKYRTKEQKCGTGK